MRRAATEIVGVAANGGWQENEVGLTSCEDSSVVRFFDRSGKDVTPEEIGVMYRHSRSVKLDWSLEGIDGITTKVNSFEGQPCAA